MADNKSTWFAAGKTAAQTGATAPSYSTPKPSYQQQQATNAGWNSVRQTTSPKK